MTSDLLNSDFNPRAPRGARPLQGAWSIGYILDFNPRAPRGARLVPIHSLIRPIIISIHALREERDLLSKIEQAGYNTFQSTRSARSATDNRRFCDMYSKISIHALREERD